MRRLVGSLLCISVLASGCSLGVTATAQLRGIKNPRGAACITSPIPAVVDIALAAATAAVVVETGELDESKGWLAVPGVFAVSGTIGVISVLTCDAGGESPAPVVPATNTAPSFGDAPVDPAARDATLEDRGAIPLTALPTLEHDLPPLVSPPPATQHEEMPECTLVPLKPCPDGSSCRLINGSSGVCTEDR